MDTLLTETKYYNVKEMFDNYESDSLLYELSRKIQEKMSDGKELTHCESIVCSLAIVDLMVFGEGFEDFCCNVGPIAVKELAKGLQLIGAKDKHEIFKHLSDLIDAKGVNWPNDISSDDDEFMDYEDRYHDFISDNSELLESMEEKYTASQSTEEVNSLFYDFMKSKVN